MGHGRRSPVGEVLSYLRALSSADGPLGLLCPEVSAEVSETRHLSTGEPFMRIARSLRLTAAAAMSSVVATIAFTGPLAGSALAAPKQRAPMPSVTATVSSTDSTLLGSRTASATAHFAWSAIGGQSYTCFLDGGSKTSCSTFADYSGIGSGTHTFSLKVAKYATFRPNTYVYTWLVDRTPPSSPPSVDSLPTPTRSVTANVTFQKTDPATTYFKCALDDSNPAHATACTSPWPLSDL